MVKRKIEDNKGRKRKERRGSLNSIVRKGHKVPCSTRVEKNVLNTLGGDKSQ